MAEYNPNPNIDFSDEAEYEQKELSIKELVLRHIKKISDICCKEFTGGYWSKKPIKTMSGVLFTEEYHEDVREAYCNAVDFLIDIVFPISDKELKEKLKSDLDSFGIDIAVKIRNKRKAFQEINMMFERMDFFKGQSVYNE